MLHFDILAKEKKKKKKSMFFPVIKELVILEM